MVSIVIPLLNEEKYIFRCLESVLDFDGQEKIVEIIIVDGGSTDASLNIISKLLINDGRIRLLINPDKYQAISLNMAIRESKGDFIMRLDAHSYYPRDYLNNCMKALIESGADNVGGVFITKLKSNSFQEKIVYCITTHWFGVGNSGFRIKHQKEYVDTVPYGFFKKDVFEKYGYFDERLIRNQDYEFNKRILKHGGKVWLDPQIKIYYHNQTSFFQFLQKQIKLEGKFNVLMWYYTPYTFTIRHIITGVFTLTLILLFFVIPFFGVTPLYSLLIIYLFMATTASVIQAKKINNNFFAILLPVCFFLFHICHGLGILYGLTIITNKKTVEF